MRQRKKRLVVNVKNNIPRVYEYYGEPPQNNLGIGGIDYIGYIVQKCASTEPFYFCDGQKVFLSEKEKNILHSLSLKCKNAFTLCGNMKTSEVYTC